MSSGLTRRDGLGGLLGGDGDNGLLSILLGPDGILSILSGDGLLSGLLGGNDDGLLGLGDLLSGILDLDDDGLLGLVTGLLDAVDELLESLGLPLLNRDEVTKREVKSKKVNFARAQGAMKKVNKELVASYNYGKAHYPAGHQLAGLSANDPLSGLLKTVFELLDSLLGGALKSGTPTTATDTAGDSSSLPDVDVGANDVTPGDANNVVSTGNNDPPPANSDSNTDAPQESPDPDTQPESPEDQQPSDDSDTPAEEAPQSSQDEGY